MDTATIDTLAQQAMDARSLAGSAQRSKALHPDLSDLPDLYLAIGPSDSQHGGKQNKPNNKPTRCISLSSLVPPPKNHLPSDPLLNLKHASITKKRSPKKHENNKTKSRQPDCKQSETLLPRVGDGIGGKRGVSAGKREGRYHHQQRPDL
jgi:hypothetical protein